MSSVVILPKRTTNTWVNNQTIANNGVVTKVGTDAVSMSGYSHITVFGHTTNGAAADNLQILVCNSASTTSSDFVKDTTKTPMLSQSSIDNTRFDFCVTYENIGAPYVGLYKKNTSGGNEQLTVFYALTS